MAHTDITPYHAFQIVEAWCRANARKCPTSQAFYGYARKSERTGRATIDGYRVDTVPHVWLYGDAFATWFASFKRGEAVSRGTFDLAAMIAEYGDAEPATEPAE
jgi:hypothetical protein